MTRNAKTLAQAAHEAHRNAGRSAGEDLAFRFAVAKDPKHPNREPGDDPAEDILMFAAWAATHFTMDEAFEQAMLEALGAEWVRTRMGQTILKLKRAE